MIYSNAQVKAVAVASLLNLIKDLFVKERSSRKQDGEGALFMSYQTGELLVGACSRLTKGGMNGGQRKRLTERLREKENEGQFAGEGEQ